MPNPKPEPDWGSAWDKPEPDWEQELQHPQAQRGEVREEIAARFNFGWRSRFESLPGYMPEAIQSDYALKMARQRQESLPGYISEEINAAMPPEWHWKNQHDTWNLDEEGKPLNQFGDSLPYGAVEWTPMGNPSYRLEGQSVFQGEWNKFVSILNAPYGYGESLWEDNRYKTGPEPTAFTDEEIQSKLEEGSIDVAQAHEMRLLVRQEREWWAKRFEKMTERVTGEPPSMGTQLGRLPGAAIKFIFGVAQIPAYGTERRLGAMNDLIATAQKDLGIHMPYERYAPEEHPEWVQNHPVTVFREEQYSNEREYWEEYFKDPAVHTLESYFRESYVDSSLAKVLGTNLALGVGVHNKNIVKGGPLDRSLDSARIKYTGIKAPQQRAEYLKRLRDGEDPEALAEELGDVWAEGIGRSVIDPLWLTDIAAHNLRDVFRWTSYAKKFLGSNEFVPKAIAAIKEVGKIVPEQMTDDVYKVASATLGIDNKSSLFRFRNFMDSQGFFALTSPGKQNRMTQMAGEVIASITRVAGDAQKQGDAFKAIVLMASDVDAERKMGLILASNFQSPKMLFSEAARNVGFLIREMYRGADGVVDANRYLKNLSVAQALGEDAVSRFVGKGLDKAIDALYPSMFERILAHDTAVAWADEGLELSQQMFDALGDNIPKYIRAAVKFDAGLPGDIKRGINTFFAYAYMGFGPGWFSRNIQNNVLTSVVDQGIAGMKYWTADGALANASAWMGQIDVAGFGPRTKMGITELKHYSSIELPDDVRKIANQVGEIQAKLDKLPKSKYVPGKDAYEEAQKLKKAIKGLDLQLGKAMKDHKLLDKASGIPSLFGPADKAERMTGANVLSAAGERAMRKQMKVGRALPEGKVLFDAELPEDVFKLFVSDIVESKGDVAGAISRLKKAITTGESPWVLSGTSFIPDKVNKQLIDHRFMQHYVDIIRDGFIKGENIEPVLTKWRAVTAGWDEMAAKVSDDVVTLADDVEGAETIIRTVSENLKAGIMDEGQVTTHFNYQNLSHQSNTNVLSALNKFRTKAERADNPEAWRQADDLLKRFDQLANEMKTWADDANAGVRGSVKIPKRTFDEITEEWHRMGLAGEPHRGITLQEFTDIRWRELWFEPDRNKRDALRNLIYEEFHDLLKTHPEIVIDKHFIDIADTAYIRSVAYDDVLRMDEVRLALASARRNGQWEYYTRTLASQYGIESVVYEGGKAIPQDAKLLGIVNDNLGTEYTKFADIPEDELNQAFMRYRVAEYAREAGIDMPTLGKAAAEVGESVPAQPYLSGLTKWTPEEYFDELEKWKGAGKNVEVELFGEEGAKKYNAAQRTANSMMASRDDTKAASKVINEMEDALSPEQQNRLFGIGDESSYDELINFKDAFEVEGMEDDLLYEIMKSRITKVDPAAEMTPDLLFMQRATQELEKRGKNVDEIMSNLGARLVADIGEENAMFILKGLKQAPVEAATARPFVPPIGSNFPLLQRMTAETADGVRGMSREVERLVRANWGKKLPIFATEDVMTPPQIKKLLGALKGWGDQAHVRIEESRLIARQVAYAARDFALHSYPEKYGWDIALSYIYPYEFWHTRTYGKWFQRMFTDTAVVATYGRYRKALETIHAGAPEWLKYSLNSDELLGIETDNPLYIKPQASLDPIQGLTGTDFNDPQKRVNWLSTTVDDLSKWGPAPHTLINFAVAGSLWSKGEIEAAKRWAPRLIPGTKAIKSGLSMLGINLKEPFMRGGLNETDPSVIAFNKGIDPYEYNRIVAELGGMVDSGEISAAQQIDAGNAAEGEIWDLAHERAIRRRAPGDLTSWGLGLSFRGRNKTDQKIQDGYTELFRIMGQKADLTDEEYRDSMYNFFKGREWMQGLLVGRKHGYARDEALAYNVLSRIQPGQLSDIISDTPGIGITYDQVQEFFETKGDSIHTWGEIDRTNFNNAMLAISSVVDLPTNATKETWQLAKDANQRMYKAIEAWRGGDIQDAINGYFTIADEGDQEGWTQTKIWDAQQEYLDDHPYVETAMDTMASWKLRDEHMAPYYASIDGVERYFNNKAWITLKAKYPDVFDEWSDYHNKMLVWDGRITQFEQDHKHVTTIKDRRNSMVEEADNLIAEFELINPVVLQIDEAYSSMWEQRAKAVRHASGTTLDKLWDGYWELDEGAPRRSYYKEHEEALELGKSMKEEGLAHINEAYTPEQIAMWEQWETATDDRWDLHRFGYKDVLRDEGFTDQQFDDYAEYNSLFGLKSEEREAMFDASEGLRNYTEVKRDLNKQSAELMEKAQGLLPTGPETQLRSMEDKEPGILEQNLYDTISGYQGRGGGYYDYTWTDWTDQIDEPVMNLIEDYIVDGYDVPEKLWDNLGREADRMGIMTPELLFRMIEKSHGRLTIGR